MIRRSILLVSLLWCSGSAAQTLANHPVRLDADGDLLPWFSDDPAEAYDFCIRTVWEFWRDMDTCCGAMPYYMIYRTWDDRDSHKGIGGDQFAMALSSWSQLYAYTGDERVKQNMRFIADVYLAHSLSPANAAWSNIPYPCNLTATANYDGDLVAGKDITQPDKAASFGWQLVTLYKMTGDMHYLDAAQKIASTLASHIMPVGDSDLSPLPFRVNAITGGWPTADVYYRTTMNWTWAMQLFDYFGYHPASDSLMNWLLRVPVRDLKFWGPFYEDVDYYSNTQINATAFVRYLLGHPERDVNWQQHARAILDATYQKFADSTWAPYGVYAIKEQTAFMVPGNSHTSDYASTELQYAEITGDASRIQSAVRQLNWATYWVDSNGMNRYPNDAVWLTDGYGDYVRYFLLAMAALPELAPTDQAHILRSSSVVSSVTYQPSRTDYITFDSASEELIRTRQKPVTIRSGSQPLSNVAWNSHLPTDGWAWKPLSTGGVVIVRKSSSNSVALEYMDNGVASMPADSILLFSDGGSLVIVSKGSGEAEFDLEVWNIAGVNLLKMPIHSGQERLRLPCALPAGIYFARITTRDGSVLRKLVVN